MERNRLGKIIATVGPASSSLAMLDKLFVAGVDVFRLNFSHGSQEAHAQVYNNIRSLSQKYHTFPTIFADLQGPKFRVGKFENNKIFLNIGDKFTLDLDKTPGDEKRVNLPHPEIIDSVSVGTFILLDDGKLKLEVLSKTNKSLETRILAGGYLSNNKGVNVPNSQLKISVLTEKDLQDLEFALNLGVDYIALSFVQTPEDIEHAKKIINNRALIISKIEKPMAVDMIEPITELSDAIMIARGDLAVEMNPEEVPPIQRYIVNTCHNLGKPVIVATQMLESMISCPTPTRAEASDIATAVYLGADATMLSAESASGEYPEESVVMMDKIITNVESDPLWVDMMEAQYPDPIYTVVDAFAMSAKNMAEFSQSSLIVLETDSFETITRHTRLRSDMPILLITSSIQLACQAGLLWSVHSVVAKKSKNVEELKSVVKEKLIEIGIEGGEIVTVANDEYVFVVQL